MPLNETRKESIRRYKEQKPRAGTYAVRCATTGNVWVGSSRNLDATKNGCWFCLRNGLHLEKSLQAEWNAHGEPAFEYEILQTLAEDVHQLELNDLLKAQKSGWIEQLGAQPLR